MKEYVVWKCAFTSSNSVWSLKLTPYDEILMSEETGSGSGRTYKWEYIPDFEKKQKEKDEN